MFDLLRFGERDAVRTDRGETLTYRQLNTEVQFFCNQINQKGLLFCLCENVLGSLVGYIACIMNGIPAVLLDGNKERDVLKQLTDIYQPEYLWLPKERKKDFDGKVLYTYQGYCLLAMQYGKPFLQKELHPELLLCMTTSGSTGSPKLVRMTKNNLRSNALAIAEYLHIDTEERPVTVLPMHYSFGISVINSHLIKGATILLTDKSVMQKEFWSFLKEEKATSISGVPYTYEMLRQLRFFRMDLPDLRTMTQAGGKLNPAFVREFAEFAEVNGKAFIVMYGQTEASPRMSYLPKEKVISKCSSIGIPIPGGHFSLVDLQGKEILEAEVEGELIYRGANVCMGYAETRAELALGDINHGELHTGDMALRDADGFYYVTGRLKRFVKIWGNRCNLDTLEQLLKDITVNCACVGVDDKITVFITERELKGRIISRLVERTGFNHRAFEVKIITEIPKMVSGKIKYMELQKLVN